MNKKVLLIFFINILIFIGGISFALYNKPYDLSIAAIMKNEKPYLKEWIEYHRLQGVEHFYLCDNDSTDGTKEYLEPYIKSGLITYIELSDADKQLVCYDKIVKEYKDKTKWLAIIDLDEYLVPLKAKDMRAFLREFDDASEVSLHWMMYGDSHAISRPDGLMTEFFTSHGKYLNHTVKSIVRPKDVIDFTAVASNHYVQVRGKSVNENHDPVKAMLNMNISGDKARVNHYIVKTFEEFLHKKSRGHPEGIAIQYVYYFFHNENDVENDTTMQRFLPKLKERMKNSPLPDVAIPRIKGLPTDFKDLYFTAEEASEILNRKITKPMNFYEVQDAKSNSHPLY